MIPKKLKELYNGVSEANDKIIESGAQVAPVCFILEKSGETSIISLIIDSPETKEASKQALKKLISNLEVIGYIVIFDSLMTTINTKTGEKEVKDVVVRNMFTPKDKFMEAVFYQDGHIIKKQRFTGKKASCSSDWNLWEDVPFDEEANEEYQKYKKEHPDLYGSVA